MYIFIILEVLSYCIGIITILYLFFLHYKNLKRISKKQWFGILLLLLSFSLWGISKSSYPIHFAMPATMHSEAPGKIPASIPIKKIAEFFMVSDFEKVGSIGADPNAVPTPITRKEPETVEFHLTAQEVIAEVTDGVSFNYWTYNKQVPGPMLRVREGDTVKIHLTNHESSLHAHNIDLHAVTGPGGGASVTTTMPGETKTVTWKALQPGLYVYHCATPNVSTHNSHGQYGLILVEPKKGLKKVDHEFYIMQGELYTQGDIGKKGLVPFDSKKLLDGIPTYVTMNGAIEQESLMNVEVGDTVRIYVGNGGVNLISSFHVIGEIFDTVYPEAAIGSPPLKNVQTTAVLPGGATIVEFTVEVPGSYLLVDHALARMNKGAWSILTVEGKEDKSIFDGIPSPEITEKNHAHESYEQ